MNETPPGMVVLRRPAECATTDIARTRAEMNALFIGQGSTADMLLSSDSMNEKLEKSE